MLMLLPPSETKTDGVDTAVLDVASLVLPELTNARNTALKTLVALAQRPAAMRKALNISVRQDAEIQRNLQILSAPTAPAMSIYNGVLYDALDFDTLTARQRQRAHSSTLITSALFGFVAPLDHIPAYRLSGSSTLPRLGVMSAYWRKKLASIDFGDQLIIDLRSTPYNNFWSPAKHRPVVTIKVMQLTGSGTSARKIAVSHFNKATKGAVARCILAARRLPENIDELHTLLTNAGFDADINGHTIEVLLRD